MHRSSSYYLSSASSSSSSLSSLAAAAVAGPSGTTAGAMDVDHLPGYDPQSDAGKEALDASCANLARTHVHLVLVVVLLWSLSTTASLSTSSEVGDVTENMVRAKMAVPLTKNRSTHDLNRSDMMARMDGVDQLGKHEVVKKPERTT